jgi:zinc transporter ZupT
MAALIALACLALVHLLAGRLRFLDVVPRSRWLSAAGGISVAYVMVHLLPELAEGQRTVEEEGALGFVEDHVYIVALFGLAVFYGVELISRRERATDDPTTAPFWLSMGSFAVYNAIIGYLVVHREEETTASLVFFTLALALHFVVNDHALRERHRDAYHDLGRWLIVAALAAGWAVGELTEISEATLGLLVAFLAGGVVLNVMKEELPEERRSSFSAFAAAAAAYTVVLQLG